jgi:general nucleoside transport system permease protein
MSPGNEQAVKPQFAWMAVARKVLAPLASVVLAVLVGSIIIKLSGDDPVAAYTALFQGAFGGPTQIGETLLRSTPLLIVGVGLAYGFRSGLFNIGAEGQLFIGGLAGAYFGLVLGGWPGWIGVPLVLILGTLGGAAWAFIPAILKARVGAHEVITTMMFTYIARYFIGYVVNGPLKAAGPIPQSVLLPNTMQLPLFSAITPQLAFGRAHAGILLGVVLAVVVWLVLKYTTTGYEARAVGLNAAAAENGGISIAATTVKSLCISGGIAGLAGCVEVLGVHHRLFDQFSSGFGFTGIAVALLAKNHPLAVIPSAILFGALSAGATTMQLEANVSTKIIAIIQALVIFFVAAETVVDWVISARQKKAVAVAQ